MTEREKMAAGLLYHAGDRELKEARQRARRLTRLLNEDAGVLPPAEREALLRELLGSAGKSPFVEPNFRCDYGFNIFVGDNFYANFDCILLDICPITIGNNVLLGPRVGIFTASHPLDARVRASGLEYGQPVTIGDDVWLGGGVIVNPGVTIGSGTIVGSGSVVTHDLPGGVIAAGSPCRALRPLTDKDAAYWRRLAREHPNL